MNEPAPRLSVGAYDSPLRYFVPSRRPNGGTYLIELDAYTGNGTCQCKDFAIRFEPLLKRGFTPQMALDSGLVELPEHKHPEDALRCEHIVTARRRAIDDMIRVYRQFFRVPLPSEAPEPTNK